MGKIKKLLKSFAKKHPGVVSFLCRLYNALPFNNSIKGKKGNRVQVCGMLKNCKIRILGKNNVLEIRTGVRLKNCIFQIRGNNNHIVLDEGVYGNGMDVYAEDNGNRFYAGKNTSFCGKIHLACTEGTGITIGQDCLFSSDIVFRTGDSHSVTDLEGNRINPAKDIVFDDHIWVGHKVLVNKGVHIGKDNVIGTGAVVTKSISESNCVIAGVPAKVVKTGINWNGER